MTGLARDNVEADDLLDAALTIPQREISTCDWLHDQIPAATYVEWAKRGLGEGDAYGLSNAICYAKRSACCRIDVLLRYNHLAPFFRGNYPEKIDALEQAGVKVPGVVHELVIEPRNKLEHDYRTAEKTVATHAVDIAELFIGATDAERQRSSVVAVNWNILGSHALARGKEYVNFREFRKQPMLFIDVFEDPATAKIVDPSNGQVRLAELGSFSGDQALELARILRSSYSQSSVSVHGAGPSYYVEMKRQAGF